MTLPSTGSLKIPVVTISLPCVTSLGRETFTESSFILRFPFLHSASVGPELARGYSCWDMARTCSLVTSMSWTSRACAWTLATSSSSVSPRTTCPQKHCMIFAIVISSFLAASYATLVARMLAACCEGVGDAAQDLLDRQGTGRGRRRDPPRRTTLDGRQGRLVFAHLACEHLRAVSRDELAGELWLETVPPSWERSLSAIISKLRALLAGAGLPNVALNGSFGHYQLALPADAWTDVEAAAWAIDRAESALRGTEPQEAWGWAHVAHQISRRPFLMGEGDRG